MDNQQQYTPSPNATAEANAHLQANNYAAQVAPAPAVKSSQATTALVAVIVVLLVVMLLLSMNGKLAIGPSAASEPSTFSAASAQNQDLRAKLNAERARQGLPPLPEDAQSATLTAERIQRDATALVTLSHQWKTELDNKDSIIGGLQTELKSRDGIASSLYKQIAELQGQVAEAGNSSQQLLSISEQLKLANSQIENYRQQLVELQGRPSNDELTLLRNQLTQNMDQRNQLQLQLDELRSRANNQVNSSELTELQAELATIRPQYDSQRYEIQKLRALLNKDRLYAESANDLPPEAAQLLTKLQTLEEANDSQLLAAYQSIGTNLNAQVVHSQGFSTGSSQITFDREKVIQDVLSQRRNNSSYFLVVGYASQSGGAENNRKLSAKRATTVASIVDTLKADNQSVKAVYLGETARFSDSQESPNQICEVWEIKR